MYFRSNNPSKIELCYKETAIHSESFEKIFVTSFELIQEFKVVNRRKLSPDRQLRDSCLLVFYNQSDMISHSVYYENKLFYTKNGALKSDIVTRLSVILTS